MVGHNRIARSLAPIQCLHNGCDQVLSRQGQGGTGDRKPSPGEVAACAPFLNEALQILKPRVVVPIGAWPWKVVGEKSMSATIGREYITDLPGGEAFVIPLPHPSGASPWANMPGNREKTREGAFAHPKASQEVGYCRLVSGRAFRLLECRDFP